jgi:RNA polymerase sigma factor (sigma-70 family)
VSRPEDEQARARFERLYRETRADLLAYVLRRAANAEDAADLLAETYGIAWRRLDAIPAGEGARLWLFGIARKLLLKGASKARTRDALVERLATELRVAEPFNHSVEDEPSGALRAALASLSMREREIVLMASWEGLTPREIGAVVGLPANVIRVRLHRARKRLKRSLFESGDAAADFLAGPGAPPAV